MCKKQFEYFFIKSIQINEITLQKYANFFIYNIIPYAYFCSGISQKNTLSFFASYKNFFINQKFNFFPIVTNQRRFLFLRVINIFEKTSLFIDNIYTGSRFFFSKIFYNNKVNKVNNITLSKYKRFSFAVKHYITSISLEKRESADKTKKLSYSLFHGRKVNKKNKWALIKYRTKPPVNHSFFTIHIIPFFTLRTYFIQKFLSKKKRNSIKFKSKLKTKIKTKDRLMQTLYTVRVRKGYKAIQPESFYFKLYSTNYQESKPNTNSFNQLKLLLGLLTNTQFSFYFINAISLARFSFDKEHYQRKNKTVQQFIIKDTFNQKKSKRYSQGFLQNIEREVIGRFRHVAIYVKDLIRIIFISLYLKKATFMVSFFRYVLAKLPRNRKETQFLRFLMQLVKIFSTHRREIIGLRFRFQGRVNRWRRTKHIIGVKGNIIYSSYNSRIVYGRAQAITRKGAQGIRLWLCYQSSFGENLRNSIYIYAALPKKIFIKKNKCLKNNFDQFKIESKQINPYNFKFKRKLKQQLIKELSI